MFKLCAPVGINVSYHASTGYKFKDRKPSLEFLEKLVKEFGVNLNWLFEKRQEKCRIYLVWDRDTYYSFRCG